MTQRLAQPPHLTAEQKQQLRRDNIRLYASLVPPTSQKVTKR